MSQCFDRRPWHYLLLACLWAVLCLPNLGGPSLWDIDEGNNVSCAQEMLASGNWVVPTFNAALRDDKPVLIYWLQILSARLFGLNEWAGRFPSALAALLGVLATYELGRRTFGKRAALLAGVILATSAGLVGAAHFANPDALLVAFTTLALALFWHDQRTGGRGWPAAVGVAAGLAVLAKGPVGLVLPGCVCLLFLLWQRRLWRLPDLRTPGMVLAFVLTAAPWYVWVALETKGAWVAGFWKNHHAQRILTAMENHSGPPYYYALVFLVGLAPWSVFLAPTVLHAWRRLRGGGTDLTPARFLAAWVAAALGLAVLVGVWWDDVPGFVRTLAPGLALAVFLAPAAWRLLRQLRGQPAGPETPAGDAATTEQAAVRFLVLWFGVYFVFFSLVRTKLPNYILPLYPPAALLTAHTLERWRRGEPVLPAWAVRAGLVCLALVGVAASLGFLLAGGRLEAAFLRGRSFPALAGWAWLGCVPVAGAAAGSWLLDRGRRGAMIAAVAASAAAFAAPLAGWGLLAMEPHKAVRPLAQLLPADQTRREVRLASYGYFQPSLVFYSRREVRRLDRPEEVEAFLAGPLPGFLFVPEGVWAGLRSPTLGAARVLGRRHDLYSNRTIVVVTNERR
jgi:4-amino-4-deoxy-L-arabinose transferase-like glycosyltransferase